MKNFSRKLSAIVLSAVFASMQISYAAMDTGLGNGIGGAVIDSTTGGFAGMTTGEGTADLNFNGNTQVNWNSLNVNSGEKLNFNAVDGANGITVLNTVTNGMSQIYGQINANSGIAKLIISNPNGMLFDGAKFTTAGDLMLTTQNLSGMTIDDLNNAKFTEIYDEAGNLRAINIKGNSVFDVSGEFNIVAPHIGLASSKIITNNGLKLVTANGQDYIALGASVSRTEPVIRIEAVDVDGDVYITSGPGITNILNGSTIDGNLKVESEGNIFLNYKNNGEKLIVNGDVDVKGNNQMMFLRNSEVKGDLNMRNDGGFVDVGNIKVGGNAKLTTTGVSAIHDPNYNHFVHVIGNSEIGGDLNIESSQNIHIGGYDYDTRKLAPGNLKVGGDLNAHSTDGHIAVTIDTSAKNIDLKSDKYNILTDGKAVLSADNYSFSSKGYIGGLTDDKQVVSVMENYVYIRDHEKPAYLNVAGGNVNKIETTGENAAAYVASNGDMTVSGINTTNAHLTSYGNDIVIKGDDNHADLVTVGKETKKLKVEFPSRDFDLKYTNIRDGKEVIVKGNDEITYELTNAEKGYNDGKQVVGETTYLVGPDKELPPPPEDPDVPGNDNTKILNNMDRDLTSQAIDAQEVYTPIAYAADLDDDDDPGVRKNVDGSVTVVRAFPMK